ncbi:hypothetical protein NQZ68_027525 [Dissostichus eleginoides]|nr:hypothetical protein NQZ68_027525 [Dissostichus eleginoides]
MHQIMPGEPSRTAEGLLGPPVDLLWTSCGPPVVNLDVLADSQLLPFRVPAGDWTQDHDLLCNSDPEPLN